MRTCAAWNRTQNLASRLHSTPGVCRTEDRRDLVLFLEGAPATVPQNVRSPCDRCALRAPRGSWALC